MPGTFSSAGLTGAAGAFSGRAGVAGAAPPAHASILSTIEHRWSPPTHLDQIRTEREARPSVRQQGICRSASQYDAREPGRSRCSWSGTAVRSFLEYASGPLSGPGSGRGGQAEFYWVMTRPCNGCRLERIRLCRFQYWGFKLRSPTGLSGPSMASRCRWAPICAGRSRRNWGFHRARSGCSGGRCVIRDAAPTRRRWRSVRRSPSGKFRTPPGAPAP